MHRDGLDDGWSDEMLVNARPTGEDERLGDEFIDESTEERSPVCDSFEEVLHDGRADERVNRRDDLDSSNTDKPDCLKYFPVEPPPTDIGYTSPVNSIKSSAEIPDIEPTEMRFKTNAGTNDIEPAEMLFMSSDGTANTEGTETCFKFPADNAEIQATETNIKSSVGSDDDQAMETLFESSADTAVAQPAVRNVGESLTDVKNASSSTTVSKSKEDKTTASTSKSAARRRRKQRPIFCD